MNAPSRPKAAVENLGKIGDAQLELVPALADCWPGLRPVEYNVIIAPAVMPEKKGSLFLPDEARESMGLAMQVGRIIDASPLAFGYERWPDEALIPGRGDLVWFARYGGGLFEGLDGREYRIVKDKDIGAVIEEQSDGE